MSRLVVDASLVLKLYFEEEDSAAARQVAGKFSMEAPELLVPEFTNTCWKKVARGQITAAKAREAAELFETAPIKFTNGSALFQTALKLSLDLNHSAYDCFYLALARRERCALVTADARLLALAPTCGVTAFGLAEAAAQAG